MSTVVVVGSQWGDEGKGKLVDVLAERAAWVVRYQGGANAGHTVDLGGTTFVLHQIPSGILRRRVRCGIGNGVVLDPDTMFTEIDGLMKDGLDVEGRLYVSERAHLVLPCHKLLDQESAASKNIDTTKQGIGMAYEDKAARRGIRVLDLRNPDTLMVKVSQSVEHANSELARFGSTKRVSVEGIMEFLMRAAPRLLPLAHNLSVMLRRAIKDGEFILLEGAQGSLLDVDHGTYPFVTSSSTTSGGACIGAGLPPTAIDTVLGVVKAYTTRVGGGPLPTEMDEELGAHTRKIGNEFGATTGRPRRCGWFDAVVVQHAHCINGFTGMAVTKLDVLDDFDRIAICTGYKIDGELIDGFPADVSLLDRVEPDYEWVDGWKASTTAARKLEDLPTLARKYLDRMHELTEVPIDWVSVGTRRDQIIEIVPPTLGDHEI